MKNYFIVNKSSRTGEAEETWLKIEEYLNNNGIAFEVHFTGGAGDATKFAKEATSTGEDVLLFVMGGDGTLNEALNGIEDFEKTYYVPVPSGSANDFVKGIGLKGTALEIVDRALNSDYTRMLDIGEVSYEGGSRRFGVSAGIGVDAYVCYQANDSKLKKVLNKLHLGQATYGLLTVGDIFSMPLSNGTITADGNTIEVKNIIFTAAMNCPAEGGGIPMVPYATAASGTLSAFVAHDIPRIKCFGVLPILVAGKHENVKGFDFINFMDMSVKLEEEMCVHADGEHIGFLKSVDFKCFPCILRTRGFM